MVFGKALTEDYRGRFDAQAQGYGQRNCGANQRMSELIGAFLGLSRVSRAEVECEALDLSAIPWTVAHDSGSGFDMTFANKRFGAFQRLHNMSEF